MKNSALRKFKIFIMAALVATGCVWALTGTASAQVTNDSTQYYYETKNRLQIIKTAQDFSGFEVLYEAKEDERVFWPEYFENRVFFCSTENSKSDSTYKLKSIDIKTKAVKTVAENASVPTILKGKVYMWKYTAPDPFQMDLWMCNLDGSGLKKTSATNVAGLYPNLYEVDGKIIFVRVEGGDAQKDGTGVFCKVNLDGSGYTAMFRKSHRHVNMFEILFLHQGYIYYRGTGNLERPDSEEGIYRTKPDGSGSKKLFHLSDKNSAGIVAPYGDKLYFFHDEEGLCSTDLAGNDRKILNFKRAEPLEMKALSTGYLSFQGIYGASTKKRTDILYSVNPGKPNIVDLEKFMPENPYKDMTIGVTLRTAPNKVNYVVGEVFDRVGFSAVSYNGINIKNFSDKGPKFVLKDGTIITEGYTFTKTGIYEVEAYCVGTSKVVFDVVVTEAEMSKLTDDVATGWYEISASNVNIGVNDVDSVVVSSASPYEAFLFTHEGNMKYTIQTADGRYLSTTGEFKKLMPLKVGIEKYLWTLTKQRSETYSLRPYTKQTMAVNVTGGKTADGTALMLWNSGVKTLTENSKFTLTPTNAPLKP